jgi:hypothetical protein
MQKPLTRLLFAQGGLCFFCKNRLPVTDASVEHLVATSNGGSNQDQNCVACCKYLNGLLGKMSLKEKIEVVLNQKGQFECPDGMRKNVRKTRPQPSSRATKPVAECYTQLVANLKQRGTAKPRSITKLRSMIAALFQNQLSTGQIDALIGQLQSRGVISVADSKVTYA